MHIIPIKKAYCKLFASFVHSIWLCLRRINKPARAVRKWQTDVSCEVLVQYLANVYWKVTLMSSTCVFSFKCYSSRNAFHLSQLSVSHFIGTCDSHLHLEQFHWYLECMRNLLIPLGKLSNLIPPNKLFWNEQQQVTDILLKMYPIIIIKE